MFEIAVKLRFHVGSLSAGAQQTTVALPSMPFLPFIDNYSLGENVLYLVSSMPNCFYFLRQLGRALGGWQVTFSRPCGSPTSISEQLLGNLSRVLHAWDESGEMCLIHSFLVVWRDREHDPR